MIQKTLTRFAFGLVVFTAIGQASAQAQTVLHYEPDVVRVSGTIKLERHYGPPNYGGSPRTDKVYVVPMLVLATPVTVQGTSPTARSPVPVDGTTFRNVAKMQMVLETPGMKTAGLEGEPVTVTGTLFEKMTGGQYTDVLISARAIALGTSR